MFGNKIRQGYARLGIVVCLG